VKKNVLQPRTELSARQRLAAAAVASGQSQRAICREHHIARETLRAWRQKPEFAAEVDRLIEQARGRILARLTTRVLPKAADAIEQTLDERPEGPPSRSEQLRAAELAMRGSGLLAQGGPGTGSAAPQVAVIVVQEEESGQLRHLAARLAAAERRWAENGKLGSKPALDDVLGAEVIEVGSGDLATEQRP
jgi:transposase-like protein